jgi:hypothetical protein
VPESEVEATTTYTARRPLPACRRKIQIGVWTNREVADGVVADAEIGRGVEVQIERRCEAGQYQSRPRRNRIGTWDVDIDRIRWPVVIAAWMAASNPA